MVPQSPDSNQHVWEKLEAYCREQAREGQELYIVAGPWGQGGVGKEGPKDLLSGRDGKIVVPGRCWKVVLILPAGVDNPKKVTPESARAFAVIIPNEQGLDTNWRNYAVAVKDVEKLTGYAFFSRLPAGVAGELKARTADTRAKPAKGPGKGGVLPAFQEGCVIGNKKNKRYRLPGEPGYAAAKKRVHAVFFKTVEEAKRAGYKPSSAGR
jgi:hypothetical protein